MVGPTSMKRLHLLMIHLLPLYKHTTQQGGAASLACLGMCSLAGYASRCWAGCSTMRYTPGRRGRIHSLPCASASLYPGKVHDN